MPKNPKPIVRSTSLPCWRAIPASLRYSFGPPQKGTLRSGVPRAFSVVPGYTSAVGNRAGGGGGVAPGGSSSAVGRGKGIERAVTSKALVGGTAMRAKNWLCTEAHTTL